MLVLVCYDVPDDRRRNRLCKTLAGFGAHVQESVFECDLDARQLAKLRQKVQKAMKVGEDNVRLYLLCAECGRRVEVMGGGVVERTPDFYIV